MSELVTLSRQGDVAIITINNPPVNALSPGVPEGIIRSLDAVRGDRTVRAVILIGGGKTFCAGADINEFGKLTSGQRSLDIGLDPMLNALEGFPQPVIAAIHGTAFGGGLETAMAAHYRVAIGSASLGQPEVNLGLIPGAGGTQRLPRLVGTAKATEMITGGKPISAADALAAGLLDQVVEGDLLAGAIAFAQTVTTPRRSRDLDDKIGNAAANGIIFNVARSEVLKRAKGLIAPMKAIDAIEAATALPFDEGIKREAELFRECLFSDQSKSLIHLFFAEREVAKIPGISKDTPRLPIRKAAVVGAGTMGGGIAMTYANAGIPVILKEVSQEALDRGLAMIKKHYTTTVNKGKLTQPQMDERLARIEPTVTYDRFTEADIVVEAVFEDLRLKKRVFEELTKVTRPDAILASNTSTLNIDEIAAVTSQPDRVIGNHFFSPAHVMKLLEVVRGKQTRLEVIATSMELAKRLGKVGVLVGNCWAFVGNRMFDPYVREANFLVEEGATIAEVDGALTAFGMAMGPLAVGDLAGLDVGWRIRNELKRPQKGRPVYAVEDRLCEMGHYGQKTGVGWYRYEGSLKPAVNPEATRLAEEIAQANGIARRTIAVDEIVERTVFALVNEGARILEEGIALRAGDIDIVYVYGYGFPAFRGGPMWYADTIGLDKVYQRIVQFEQQHGSHWKPAPLLKQFAESGKKFRDLDRTG